MAQIFDRLPDPNDKLIPARCASAAFKVSNGSIGSRPFNAIDPQRTFEQSNQPSDRWPARHMCYGIKSRQPIRQLHICRLCSALFRTTGAESIAELCCRECQPRGNHHT